MVYRRDYYMHAPPCLLGGGGVYKTRSRQQRGYGIYRGHPKQRGYGFSTQARRQRGAGFQEVAEVVKDKLGNVIKAAIPFVKKAAAKAGMTALRAAPRILLSRDKKAAAKTTAKQIAQDTARDALQQAAPPISKLVGTVLGTSQAPARVDKAAAATKASAARIVPTRSAPTRRRKKCVLVYRRK